MLKNATFLKKICKNAEKCVAYSPTVRQPGRAATPARHPSAGCAGHRPGNGVRARVGDGDGHGVAPFELAGPLGLLPPGTGGVAALLRAAGREFKPVHGV